MPSQSPSDPQYLEVAFREMPSPGVRYSSGLTIYDEALVKGRWVGRYWSAAGRIKPERDIAKDLEFSEPLIPHWLKQLPLDSFCLDIDGQSLQSHWKWTDAKRVACKDNSTHALVELSHGVRPVNIRVHMKLDGTPFLVRWLEITNTSDRPAALSSVSPWSGLLWSVLNYRELLPAGMNNAFSLGYYASEAWGWEGDFVWEPLLNGVRRIEGKKGRSGHACPFFMVRNEGTGEYFVGHIAWSGNWKIDFRCDQDPASQDALLFFKAGPSAPSPQRVLGPGETISTPAVHLGLLHADLDGCVQALHDHIRHSVMPAYPKGRRQLVQYNAWGYVADDLDEQLLLREVDMAADIGCELFIVDAGWYGAERKNWYNTVGDWFPGSWLPNGLEPARKYARRRGLLFGLWVEIECAGDRSNLLKEHPDWILKRDGEPVPRALDLTRPEVASWVESEIVRLIERYDLDLFRLDYNINVYEAGQTMRDGYVENTLWRHYETLYGIFERVRERFPNIILQNCSSGGGRNDLGMLGRFHETQLTDWCTLPRGLKILNGMTLALPPESLIFFSGFVTQQQSLRGDLDTQLRTCILGLPWIVGVAPSQGEVNTQMRDRMVHHINLYKNFIRPILPSCKVFHHAPILRHEAGSEWCVLEYDAPDASKGVAAVFRLTPGKDAEYHFRSRGLDPAKRYRVTFDNTGKIAELDGWELIKGGLTVLLDSPLTSELLLFESA